MAKTPRENLGHLRQNEQNLQSGRNGRAKLRPYQLCRAKSRWRILRSTVLPTNPTHEIPKFRRRFAAGTHIPRKFPQSTNAGGPTFGTKNRVRYKSPKLPTAPSLRAKKFAGQAVGDSPDQRTYKAPPCQSAPAISGKPARPTGDVPVRIHSFCCCELLSLDRSDCSESCPRAVFELSLARAESSRLELDSALSRLSRDSLRRSRVSRSSSWRASRYSGRDIG